MNYSAILSYNCKVMIVALKVAASKLHVKVESNFYV